MFVAGLAMLVLAFGAVLMVVLPGSDSGRGQDERDRTSADDRDGGAVAWLDAAAARRSFNSH